MPTTSHRLAVTSAALPGLLPFTAAAPGFGGRPDGAAAAGAKVSASAAKQQAQGISD